MIYGVILAGGQSSRLFPFNKVLSDLTGSGRTLLQQSFDRLVVRPGPLLPKENVYVLTVRDMVPSMRRQLGLPPSHFLADPVRRGTWPALLWAMAHLRRRDPNALVAVVTADHVIPDRRAFRESVRGAVKIAQEKPAMVMVNVQPSDDPRDWLGFGAVRSQGTRIAGFEEKPGLERAQEMIQEGGWYWNAGMFFYRISTAEAALQRFQPAMARTYKAICEALVKRNTAAAARLYAEFPAKIVHPLDADRQVDNTIDYAVMTPLSHQSDGELSAQVAPLPIHRWTDLGQWTALRQVVKADRHGNVRVGTVHVDPSVKDSILAADQGHKLQVRNLHGMIAAFSGKTLLLLPQSQVAQVKAFVQAAREAGPASLFDQNCQGCDFDVKKGRVLACGLSEVSVRLRGSQVVIAGPRFIR